MISDPLDEDNLVTEELLAIKVAIQYRSCTQHISSRLVQRGAQGSIIPHIGAVRLDNVRFLPLQHAVLQAKTRGIFAPLVAADNGIEGGPASPGVSTLLQIPTNSRTRGDGARTDRVFFGVADSLTQIRRAVMDNHWLRADAHNKIGSFSESGDWINISSGNGDEDSENSEGMDTEHLVHSIGKTGQGHVWLQVCV